MELGIIASALLFSPIAIMVSARVMFTAFVLMRRAIEFLFEYALPCVFILVPTFAEIVAAYRNIGWCIVEAMPISSAEEPDYESNSDDEGNGAANCSPDDMSTINETAIDGLEKRMYCEFVGINNELVACGETIDAADKLAATLYAVGLGAFERSGTYIYKIDNHHAWSRYEIAIVDKYKSSEFTEFYSFNKFARHVLVIYDPFTENTNAEAELISLVRKLNASKSCDRETYYVPAVRRASDTKISTVAATVKEFTATEPEKATSGTHACGKKSAELTEYERENDDGGLRAYMTSVFDNPAGYFNKTGNSAAGAFDMFRASSAASADTNAVIKSALEDAGATYAVLPPGCYYVKSGKPDMLTVVIAASDVISLKHLAENFQTASRSKQLIISYNPTRDNSRALRNALGTKITKDGLWYADIGSEPVLIGVKKSKVTK